jgi:hypothetical protein
MDRQFIVIRDRRQTADGASVEDVAQSNAGLRE